MSVWPPDELLDIYARWLGARLTALTLAREYEAMNGALTVQVSAKRRELEAARNRVWAVEREIEVSDLGVGLTD